MGIVENETNRKGWFEAVAADTGAGGERNLLHCWGHQAGKPAREHETVWLE